MAILHAGGLGKLPDEQIISRIQALRGPIDLRTYISLSCENCPDVVQSLNMMTIFHPEMTHTMIDGSFAQGQIEELGIRGVPSVMAADTLVSSGKATLTDLLSKLEAEFGKSDVGGILPKDLGRFDTVVIGGGPAGASAAIYAARKGLKTAIVAEQMGGQVKETKGIENLVSIPYTEGPELTQKLANHISEYPVTVLEHRRVLEVAASNGARISLDSGEFLSADSTIIATGAKWRELNVPGEKEYLGSGVAYCPHCDGPLYRDKDVAVVGGGNSGVEAALDLAGIVNSVTLFEFMPDLKADQILVEKLERAKNIRVIKNARVLEVQGNGKAVTGVLVEDRKGGEREVVALEGVFVQIGLSPNSGFVKDLVEVNSFGEILVDEKGRTNVPLIYAAGDVTTVPFKQIIISMGEGAKAALTAFEDRLIRAVSTPDSV